MLEKKIEPDEGDLADLESTFQQIQMVTGLTDLQAVVEKVRRRAAAWHPLVRAVHARPRNGG